MMRYFKLTNKRRFKCACMGGRRTLLVVPEIKEPWVSQHAQLVVLDTKVFLQYYKKPWKMEDIKLDEFDYELRLVTGMITAIIIQTKKVKEYGKR